MSILSRLFGGREPSSRQVAKERLQLVLVHDRSNLSPEQVERMKDEILEVISRYVEFDPQMVNIRLTNQERESILHAEIPIYPGQRRRRATTTT
ncbi:MAG TPA: cell division topological specificity factor MinE [Aggregatilineales bacterium]|nr:cell division topological specificity factor MinE [Aggregatilineales bacterium]